MTEDQILMLAFIETKMKVNQYYPVTLKAGEITYQLMMMDIPSLSRLEFSNDYKRIRILDWEQLPGAVYSPSTRIGCYWSQPKN